MSLSGNRYPVACGSCLMAAALDEFRHTDKTPVRENELFDDNWDLSQARARSVVRYMVDELGIPADRLAATGFGEHRPISEGEDPQSLARNRRIELKFTER